MELLLLLLLLLLLAGGGAVDRLADASAAPRSRRNTTHACRLPRSCRHTWDRSPGWR